MTVAFRPRPFDRWHFVPLAFCPRHYVMESHTQLILASAAEEPGGSPFLSRTSESFSDFHPVLHISTIKEKLNSNYDGVARLYGSLFTTICYLYTARIMKELEGLEIVTQKVISNTKQLDRQVVEGG